MADIDLEAEQVVGEEMESAPKKSRSMPRMGLLVFGAVVIVEAVVLFFVFDAISSPEASAETKQVEKEPDKVYSKYGRIVVSGVSVFDESDMRAGADRRFSMDVTVWISIETYASIQTVADGENDQIFEVIKDRLRTEIRDFLARQGGASLKSRVNEKDFREDLTDHLEKFLPELKVQDVYISNFRPQRY